MTSLSLERDSTIYREMISHTALFSHRLPQKIAIIGDSDSDFLEEILKHHSIKEVWTTYQSSDPRIKTLVDIHSIEHCDFDVLIISKEFAPELYPQYFNLLASDGILIQQSESPYQIHLLKAIQQTLQKVGFHDFQTLNFPQPNFSTGWRSAILAKKQGVFKKIREKDIFNKPFATHYYNFDMHKAALAVPEFMKELTI